MKALREVTVIESFQVSQLGILVFLQTENEGLASGTLLKSLKSGASWIVKNRFIAYPDIEQPFDNEIGLQQHLSFSTVENKVLSERKAAERLKNKIYQYLLEGTDKPEKEEVLTAHLIEIEPNDADRTPM